MYPNSPGFRNTDTSIEAANFIKFDAQTLRASALKIVCKSGNEGSTADETAELLGQSVLSIRPRFSELKKMAKIIDSGVRRSNGSGRKATVWIKA